MPDHTGPFSTLAWIDSVAKECFLDVKVVNQLGILVETVDQPTKLMADSSPESPSRHHLFILPCHVTTMRNSVYSPVHHMHPSCMVITG